MLKSITANYKTYFHFYYNDNHMIKRMTIQLHFQLFGLLQSAHLI